MWFLIFSVIIISFIGTLSHFLYDISNHNKVIGLFSAVNESTWEHVKIALTPTLLWGLLDGFIYGSNSNYFLAKFISLLIIIILTPTLYYGHKAIIKNEIFCSSKEHERIEANIFCQECQINMCNKCKNLHSSLFFNHHTVNIGQNSKEIFTGFCTIEKHRQKLQYFCKDHNKL